VSYHGDGISFLHKSRKMFQESGPVWRSICAFCRSVLGYLAVLCEVPKGYGPTTTTEHETRGFLGTAERGGTDERVVTVESFFT
jgi:hypothetical protein